MHFILTLLPRCHRSEDGKAVFELTVTVNLVSFYLSYAVVRHTPFCTTICLAGNSTPCEIADPGQTSSCYTKVYSILTPLSLFSLSRPFIGVIRTSFLEPNQVEMCYTAWDDCRQRCSNCRHLCANYSGSRSHSHTVIVPNCEAFTLAAFLWLLSELCRVFCPFVNPLVDQVPSTGKNHNGLTALFQT